MMSGVGDPVITRLRGAADQGSQVSVITQGTGGSRPDAVDEVCAMWIMKGKDSAANGIPSLSHTEIAFTFIPGMPQLEARQ